MEGPGIEPLLEGRAIQSSPEAHQASCKMGTGSLPRIKWSERGTDHDLWYVSYSQACHGVAEGRIKLFGAQRQWKHFRPLFQAVFLSGVGGVITPQTVKHHTSQSQDRNNKYFILYLNFASIIKFKM